MNQVTQPTWPERYYLGLDNIKSSIEAALTEAGAKIGHNSVFHPRLPPSGLELPRTLTITVVPLDGPRIAIEFAREEILKCADGSDEVIFDKIRTYIDGYRNFRSGPDRNVRVFERAVSFTEMTGGKAPAEAKAGAPVPQGKSHDRARINVDEDHEVRFWCRQFGIDEATLRSTVKAAGTSVNAVRNYIRNGKHK